MSLTGFQNHQNQTRKEQRIFDCSTECCDVTLGTRGPVPSIPEAGICRIAAYCAEPRSHDRGAPPATRKVPTTSGRRPSGGGRANRSGPPPIGAEVDGGETVSRESAMVGWIRDGRDRDSPQWRLVTAILGVLMGEFYSYLVLKDWQQVFCDFVIVTQLLTGFLQQVSIIHWD